MRDTAAMKFTPFVVVTVMIGAFVGWFAPDGAGPSAVAGSAPVPNASTRLDVARDRAWNAGEVVLERAGDGHFYADVLVEGATARMLVDTGASVVALTGEDADALGVEWDEEAVRPVARGASGDVYGVRVTIGSMQVGEFEVQAVDAVVVPEGLGISLLGQSFLSQVPRVAMDKEKMVLGG